MVGAPAGCAAAGAAVAAGGLLAAGGRTGRAALTVRPGAGDQDRRGAGAEASQERAPVGALVV